MLFLAVLISRFAALQCMFPCALGIPGNVHFQLCCPSRHVALRSGGRPDWLAVEIRPKSEKPDIVLWDACTAVLQRCNKRYLLFNAGKLMPFNRLGTPSDKDRPTDYERDMSTREVNRCRCLHWANQACRVMMFEDYKRVHELHVVAACQRCCT